LAVGAQQGQLWQLMTGVAQPVGEQVQPVELSWLGAVAQVFEQHAARTAAHFENAQAREPIQPEMGEQRQRNALPLLEGEQGGRVEGRVAVVPGQAAGAVGVFEAQAVEVGQRMV